nr:DNA repair protein RadA [Candidatus Bipolaricaulota bacterium]
IGKSTLLLQVARAVSAQSDVLYVSGEESAAQIKLRASRLGVDSDRVYVLCEQNLGRVAEAVENVAPRLLIVDSIQTMRSDSVPGEAGNVRQLREVSAELARLTKRGNLSTFLVGHVTKDGGFAGPKVVEHLVDVALYLEGTRGEDVRALRSVKNRFGATNDVALYQMTAAGLKEIADPSRFFLEQHSAENRTGVAVVPVLEGSRAVLVEVQALVAPTGGYGVPQRRCTGLDVNRVLLLLAVAERHLGVQLGGADVYLSVAGGLEARERGVDLAIVAAIMSSLRNRPIDPRTAVIGEVGLSGELRGVRRLKERLVEVEKLGYDAAVVPERPTPPKRSSLNVRTAANISDAMQLLGLA